MNIRKTVVAKLIETGASIDKVSRRKNVSGEELAQAAHDALRFVRSVLTTLRKLK